MLIYNSFSDLFNATCAHSGCLGDVFAVPVSICNGLADISDFLSLMNLNETEHNNPSSNENVIDAWKNGTGEVPQFKTEDEFKKRVEQLCENLNDKIDETGIEVKTAVQAEEAIKRLKNKEEKELYAEEYRELVESHEIEYDQYTGNLHTTDEEDNLLCSPLRQDFMLRIQKTANPEELTDLFVKYCLGANEEEGRNNLNYNPDKVGRTILDATTSKPIGAIRAGKLIKKAKEHYQRLSDLIQKGFKKHGFRWSPDKGWYNSDYPPELVSCANMVFASEFAKVVIERNPLGYAKKNEHSNNTNGMFLHQDSTDIEGGVRYFGDDGLGHSYWEFVTRGDKGELKRILISLHILDQSEEYKKNTTTYTPEEKYLYKQGIGGNNEVERITYLLDLPHDKYLGLKISDKENATFKGSKKGEFDQTLSTPKGRRRISTALRSQGSVESIDQVIQRNVDKALGQRLIHYIDYIQQDDFPAKPIILDIPNKFLEKYNKKNPEFEWSKLLYEQWKNNNIKFDEPRFLKLALKSAKNDSQRKEAIEMVLKDKTQEKQESLVKELVDMHLLSSSDIQKLLQ